MERTRVWITGIVALAGMAGCGTGPFSSTQPLTGKTYLAAPLDGAKVVFETAAGTPIETTSGGTTSQGRFFERLLLTSPAPLGDVQWLTSYLPLTVTVTGGTCNGTPFDGTLLGYVSSFSTGKDVHVNILTTLIVKYKLAANVTFEQAEAAVTGLLRIPQNSELAGKLDDSNYWYLFDPTRFMQQAQAKGGFDAFTDQIVSNMMNTQTAGASFVAGAAEGVAGSIASKAADWLLESAGEGVVAWGVGEGMDWILSAFGYENPTDKALSQIESQLTQVNNTLNNIQSEIGTLTSQMSQLLSLVQLSWDSLTSTISSLNMSSQEDVIQNQYNNLVATYTATSANLCTVTGNTMATNFAQAILSPQAYDVDQQIYDMYANLTGKNPGSNGALYDLTSKLVDQVQSGQDLYNAYLALENYYGQLAGIQAQGLALMMGAINQPLNPTDGSGTITAQWTPTQYYNKFMSQMSQQTEVFLACVDRLVVASVNVQSQIVQPIAYLSPETAAIYNRADFVASQLSTTQPSGLNIRLIGDPGAVSNWIANQQIQVAGQNPVVVSVNGNNINNYTATIPSSTPGVSYYLEWTPNVQNTAFTFQKQTQVSVVKLNVPATAAGSFTVTTPTQTQTLNVAPYNNSFQTPSATDNPIITYGSGVFYVRTLPTWQAGEAGFPAFQNTNNTFGGSWTPAANNVQMTLTTYPVDIEWWIMAGSTYQGQLVTTIINGAAGNVPVALNWNGTRNTTTNWSGGPGTSANQSLICQTTTQTITTSGQAQGQPVNVTLTPNTSTPITYQASQSWSSSSGLEYGWNLTTNAWLNSLELVPQQ